MNALTIQISGEIQQSNFVEWKSSLVEQLQAVNTELVNDAHFVAAGEHVKSFKSAEKALSQAKQSALEQAADINALFAAIDEVAEQTRQVRLTLQRQIKSRKQEIKDAFIQQGVDNMQALIDTQDADVRLVDHSALLNPDILTSATKGKTSSSGMKKAIDEACTELQSQLSARAALIRQNATRLDSLPSGHIPLFQDRANLLGLGADKLSQTLDQRIQRFNEETHRTAATETTTADSASPANEESDVEQPDYTPATEQLTSALVASSILIKVRATRATIDTLRTELEKNYAGRSEVISIELH